MLQSIITQYMKPEFPMKIIHSDGGTEFINSTVQTFCDKHGIRLSPSPAATPQLNGVAERNVRTSKERITALLNQSGLSSRTYWRYAAAFECFVWNRTYISKRTGITPYESIRRKKPEVKFLGIFGCDAYINVPKKDRSTSFPSRNEK